MAQFASRRWLTSMPPNGGTEVLGYGLRMIRRIILSLAALGAAGSIVLSALPAGAAKPNVVLKLHHRKLKFKPNAIVVRRFTRAQCNNRKDFGLTNTTSQTQSFDFNGAFAGIIASHQTLTFCIYAKQTTDIYTVPGTRAKLTVTLAS
jgi:hypothetical protein